MSTEDRSRSRRNKGASPANMNKSPSKTANCAECSLKINTNDKSVKCGDCYEWYHQKCTSLTTAEYNILQHNKNIKYQCSDCEKQVNASNRFQILEARVEKLEIDNESTKTEANDMRDILRMIQQQNETLQSQNETILKFFDNYKGENLENNIKAHVHEIIDDQKEVEEKQNCLIVFNMEEKKEPDTDQSQEDVNMVKELFQVTNPDLDTSKLTKENVFRLRKKGNQGADAQTNKCAPIKVKLPNPKIKMSILSNGKKLKGHPKFGKVGIQMDMTKIEQEKHRALRTELNERRSNGEDVMIFDGQVILKSDRSKLADLRSNQKKNE